MIKVVVLSLILVLACSRSQKTGALKPDPLGVNLEIPKSKS